MENESVKAAGRGTDESAPALEKEQAEAVNPPQAEPDKAENSLEESEKKPVQSREENARFAARRREEERRAEVNRQVKEQMQHFYEQFRAAYESQDSEDMVNRMRKAGLDEESARWAADAVRQNQARAYVQRQQELADKQWELEKSVQDQLEELNRKYPECGIQTPEQLRENEELCEKAAGMQGGSLADAYVLLHHEELCEAAAKAARQEAINAARSTEHLHSIRAAGALAQGELSEEEYEGYKLFGFSRQEAARAHKKLYGR